MVQRLKEIRLSKKLTQAELSNISGISQQYISDIENEISAGSVHALKRLAKALGVSVAELLDDRTA